MDAIIKTDKVPISVSSVICRKPTLTFSIIFTGNNAFIAELYPFLMRLPVLLRKHPRRVIRKQCGGVVVGGGDGSVVVVVDL
jgi:hypothetical protein